MAQKQGHLPQKTELWMIYGAHVCMCVCVTVKPPKFLLNVLEISPH